MGRAKKEKPAVAAEPAEMPSNSRLLQPGTVLMLGSQPVVLPHVTPVEYDRAADEPYFAALCRMTDNYEVNEPLLKERYDMHGRVIMPDPE